MKKRNRFSETKEAQKCIEILRRGMEFLSVRDRSFAGPLTFPHVPTLMTINMQILTTL